MGKIELEYLGCMSITHSVDVLLLDASFLEDEHTTAMNLLIWEAFVDFLEEVGLSEYWKGCFEISPVCSYDGPGAKFSFTRLTKRQMTPESMGSGTQWVSDVVELMKDFLVYAKQSDDPLEASRYRNARLVFRHDRMQYEWK